MLSRTEFADALSDGWLVAVDADKTEHHLEGVYWLARLSGPAFVIPEDMVHSGQKYREGWVVAPGQWYALRQRSERGYELLTPKVWIVVDHMIRLKGLAFRGSQAGPQGRELRQIANPVGPAAAGRARGSGLFFLDEEIHHEILACAEYAEPEDEGSPTAAPIVDPAPVSATTETPVAAAPVAAAPIAAASVAAAPIAAASVAAALVAAAPVAAALPMPPAKCCGACKQSIQCGSHTCKLGAEEPDHQVELHSHVICDKVWMPEDGMYFCSRGCIGKFNALKRRCKEGGMVPQRKRPLW